MSEQTPSGPTDHELEQAYTENTARDVVSSGGALESDPEQQFITGGNMLAKFGAKHKKMGNLAVLAELRHSDAKDQAVGIQRAQQFIDEANKPSGQIRVA